MKNKTIKRLLAAVISCSMLAACLTGCGNNSGNASKTSESQTASASGETSVAEKTSDAASSSTEEEFDARAITEGVTLTIAVASDTRVADYDDNDVTHNIEETWGVNLEFIVIPSEDFKQKINLMINSGEKLPDIILSASGYDSSWVTAGAILDLSKYYDDPNYSPNITKAAEENDTDIRNYLTTADGKIYGLPRWEANGETQTYKKMWIYKPWLDALGLEVPDTLEEYYEACKLVVENDMNGNGKRDEIATWGVGLSGAYNGWFGTLMSGFVYAHDGSYRVVEDGKVSFAYTTDEWKEGLKYIKKFFDEGLIPTEIFTQNTEAYEAQMFAEVPTVFSFCQYHTRGTDAVRESEYTYVVGLKDENGENGYSYWTASKPANGGVITTDCENPDAAFIVCDYIASEYISICNRYGTQGVHWDYWENVKDEEWAKNYGTASGEEPYIVGTLNICRDPEAENIWSASTPHTTGWRNNGFFLRTPKLMNSFAGLMVPTTEEQELSIFNSKKFTEATQAYFANRKEEIYDHGPTTSEEDAAIADAKSALNSYVQEMIAAFVTGGQDIDAYWDTYLAELDKIGIDEVLEVYQTAYDRVH